MAPFRPAVLIEITVEPRSEADRERLIPGLIELATADPDLGFYVDRESGQLVLQAQTEAQLDAKLDMLIRERGIGMDVGAPQVAYRETITRPAEVDHVYTSLIHEAPVGTGQFARVQIRFEPTNPETGFVFEVALAGVEVPEAFIPAVHKGLEAASDDGLLAGFPVIGLKATLVGGAYHDLDSSAAAFEIAARRAFRDLRDRGAPVLLEPVMLVETVTPDQYLTSVIGDLNARRGAIRSTATEGDLTSVEALVPLATLFGYARNLSGMTEGRGRYEFRYDHYAEVPRPLDPDDDFSRAVGMRA